MIVLVPALAGASVTAGLATSMWWSVWASVLVAGSVSAVRIASLRFHWKAIAPRDMPTA